MKVKIHTVFPKRTIEVDDVFFSSDLHLGHPSMLTFGRDFTDTEVMDSHIVSEINKKVKANDMLILLGDTMMGDKNYADFLFKLECKNVIMLIGNHCNRGKLLKVLDSHQAEKLIHVADYLEISVDKQYICCSHYPQFNWNHQEDGAFHLHGHLHADESPTVKEIHKYKSMDVGLDNFFKMFGNYSVFSMAHVKDLLKDKLITNRHSNT